MKKNRALDLGKIKSKSPFIVASADAELISEHLTPSEACAGLARYFHATRLGGTIYKRQKRGWVVY